MSVLVPGASGGLLDAIATPIDAAAWSHVRLMPPAALKVLLVEDEVLVGLYTCDLLRGLGAEKVIFANTIAESIRHLENGLFDVVLIDALLQGVPAASVVEAVSARGIPFGFVTGFSDLSVLPEHMRQYARIEKPISEHKLIAFLAEVLGRKDGKLANT
jgi:DNA-binding NtrC family response regulator